jgi:hypothetical protein
MRLPFNQCECLPNYELQAGLKNPSGDLLYLRDLIEKCLQEPSWNVSRNCKQALPKFKDMGDKSAHSRSYNAHRGDIDPLLADIQLGFRNSSIWPGGSYKGAELAPFIGRGKPNGSDQVSPLKSLTCTYPLIWKACVFGGFRVMCSYPEDPRRSSRSNSPFAVTRLRTLLA